MNLPLQTTLFAGLVALTSIAMAEEAWPSPVTWKVDKRASDSGLYIEPKSAAKKEKVEFQVEEPSGVKRQQCPVRGSIALFRGELADAKDIRLVDGSGKEIPVQGMFTAFWPEKTGRFLCIDFLTDLDAKQNKKFTLEYGSEVKAKETTPIKVSSSGGKSASVETGSASFKFKEGADFLQVSLTKPAVSLKAITGRALVAKDLKGSNPANLPLIIDEVTGVEKGAVQATLHLKGHYGDQKANAPANDPNEWRYPVSMYVRIYGNTGQAYVEHTFGYNGDEYSDYVVSYGLVIPTGAKNAKFLYGVDDDSKDCALGVRLNQYSNNQYKLTGKSTGEGKRIAGWAGVKGDGIQVVAALRNAFQNWPVAFGAEENGNLVVELFGEAPERALDLAYHENGQDEAIHKSHSFYCGEALDTDYETPFHSGKAQGIAKIHELLLDFSGGATSAAQIGRSHEVGLVPWAGQERIAQTRALGHIAVYGDGKYDFAKEYFSVLLDILPVVHEANGLYGWVDWGDVPMMQGPQGGKFDLILAGGVGWQNGERFVPAYIYHYAAGGGRRFLDYGRAMVYHTLGIDTEHRGGGANDGKMGAYHRHTQAHWRSEGGTRQGGYRGWNAYYWLTGDRQIGQDAIEYGIDAPANAMCMNLAASNPTPSVLQDYQSSSVHSLAEMNWITTGDWRYARHIHACASLWKICGEQGKCPQNGWVFFQVQNNEPVGYTMGDPGAMNGYWVTYGEDDMLLDWISLTGDPAAVDAVLNEAKYYGPSDQLYHCGEGLHLAFAALKPDVPGLKDWITKRLMGSVGNGSFQNRKAPDSYKSAEEWHGYNTYLYGKNGYSILGSQATEVLISIKGLEVLEKGRAALTDSAKKK